FTDLKCGSMYNGKAIRWTLNDLKRGYQYIEDRKVHFIDTLQYKSVIKLDLIALLKGYFVEITINYFFQNGSRTTRIEEDQLNSFKSSFNKHYKAGEYYKALKRLYKYYAANKDTKKVKRIASIFNSDLGRLNKSIIDLELIQTLLNIRPKPSLDDIKHNLNLIATMSKEMSDNIRQITTHSFKSIDGGIQRVLIRWQPLIEAQYADHIKKFMN